MAVILPIIGAYVAATSAAGGALALAAEEKAPTGSFGGKIADLGHKPLDEMRKKYRNVMLQGNEYSKVCAKADLCNMVIGFGNFVYKIERAVKQIFSQKDALQNALHEWHKKLELLAQLEQIDAKMVQEFQEAFTKSHEIVEKAKIQLKKLEENAKSSKAKISYLTNLLDQMGKPVEVIRRKIEASSFDGEMLAKVHATKDRAIALLALIKNIPVQELAAQTKKSIQDVGARIQEFIDAKSKVDLSSLPPCPIEVKA